MKKRGNIKNPCKICHQRVSKKNGIQCHGACKKWSHFTCLQYTPGKIRDIKAGLITVTCPCPDCYLPEPLGTCQESSTKITPVPPMPQQESPSKLDYAFQEFYPTMIGDELQNIDKLKKNQQLMHLPKNDSLSTLIFQDKSTSPKQETESPSDLVSHSYDSLPDTQRPRINKLKQEINLQKMSISCSCLVTSYDFRQQFAAVSSSDSTLPTPNNQVLLSKLEQMCDTVGDLSLQIRRLVFRMVESSPSKRY